MLASYVLNPERRHGLKALTLELLGVELQEIDTRSSGKNAGTMDLVEMIGWFLTPARTPI
jgi:hypothetical protein